MTIPTPTVTVKLFLSAFKNDDRVELLVGGFRGEYGVVTDYRYDRYYLTLDTGIPLGGFRASELRLVGA